MICRVIGDSLLLKQRQRGFVKKELPSAPDVRSVKQADEEENIGSGMSHKIEESEDSQGWNPRITRNDPQLQG